MHSKYLALIAIALTATMSAKADPIVGSVSFGGSAIIDFAADAVDIGGDTAIVTGSSGDFASTLTTFVSTVTYNDFSYGALGPGLAAVIWTGGGFSFTLDSFTLVDEQPSTPSLVLTGTGWISGTGFDTTSGNWSFSADSVGDSIFAFSSQTAARVPEPGSLALLGLGLLGWAGWSAQRKALSGS